jgi:hypothetical protein
MKLIPVLLLFMATSAFAQIREVPKAVKDSFTARYPGAGDVKYLDNLVNVNIIFQQDSAKMTALFTNKGEWKQTAKDWSYDRIPEDVQDGFNKSKYGETEWKITESSILYFPKGAGQYRIKIEKGDLQKKYLFFNERGRLLKETLIL